MNRQLHTEDLAGTDPADDDVVMAELVEPSPAPPTQSAPAAGQPSAQPVGQQQHQGRATTGQPTTAWPPYPDGKHWAGLSDHEAMRARWEAIQAGFVDEPRRAVEDADALVAQVIRQLAESFATERARLEAQWSRGDQVSTEDLRVALQRYRSFFQDLLSH